MKNYRLAQLLALAPSEDLLTDFYKDFFMGFVYRYSQKAGPLKLNLSKSGSGFSAAMQFRLPGLGLSSENLTFTVIRGAVVGNFEANAN